MARPNGQQTLAQKVGGVKQVREMQDFASPTFFKGGAVPALQLAREESQVTGTAG